MVETDQSTKMINRPPSPVAKAALACIDPGVFTVLEFGSGSPNVYQRPQSTHPEWTLAMKRLIRDFVVGAVASLVVSLAVGYILYNRGHSDGQAAGFKAGSVEGVAAGWKEFEAEKEEQRTQLDDELAQKRTDAQKEREREDQKFTEDLQKREQEFRLGLETLVTERYAEVLSNARQVAHDTGFTEGEVRGHAVGLRACETACETRIEEFISYGRLWDQYVEAVAAYALDYPERETDMRARAQTIVTIALDGRSAARGLAAQLNGQIDELINALEDNDLDKVREIIVALHETMGSKAEAWRRNFRTLSLYDQS